jgi:hypothetical protein
MRFMDEFYKTHGSPLCSVMPSQMPAGEVFPTGFWNEYWEYRDFSKNLMDVFLQTNTNYACFPLTAALALVKLELEQKESLVIHLIGSEYEECSMAMLMWPEVMPFSNSIYPIDPSSVPRDKETRSRDDWPLCARGVCSTHHQFML